MNLMILAGLLVGLGGYVCVRQLLPAHSRPSLDAALQRRATASSPTGQITATDWKDRLGRRLALRMHGSARDPRIPRTDLALLNRSVETFLAQKAILLAVGLVASPLLGLLLGLNLQLTGLATLVLAGYLFFVPDVAIKSQAKEARQEFRVALVCYLELVSLAASAGKSTTESLEAPAKIGSGWVFRRIGSALDPGRRGTRDAWSELDRLATQIDVPELGQVAVISRRAGAQGASVLDTLHAKAASLRGDQHAQALARAKAATETMTIPLVLIVLGFTVLLGFPAFVRISG